MPEAEFSLAAYGQEWHVRFLPAHALIPRRKAVDAWRAAIGDVFIEVHYIEGEPRAELERRLLWAIGGHAYRGMA